MGIRNRICKAAAAAFLLAGSSPGWASGGADPSHFIGRYEFTWGGVPLGSLVLSFDEAATRYTVRLKVASGGIINLFTHHVSDTRVEGTRDAHGYHPRAYESHYQTKSKPRHIQMAFDARGRVARDDIEPPEDPAERPQVPADVTANAYDPLTGFLVLRNGATPIRAFDAKRLYDVNVSPRGTMTMRQKEGDRAVGVYVLKRTPVAGLTEKETREYAKGEPPLTLYLSDDARHIPVALTLPVALGSVRGSLVRECATWDECAN